MHSGIDQQDPCLRHRRHVTQCLSDPLGQGGFFKDKERYIGTQSDTYFHQALIGEVEVQQFVQSQQDCRRIAAAAAQAGGNRNVFGNGDGNPLGTACLLKHGMGRLPGNVSRTVRHAIFATRDRYPRRLYQ